MKPLAPNTLLQNRYLIVHLIGKGGMGEVYLAVDQRLGSAIALKRTFFSDDETLGNAFEREARTLARLRHPVLPKVSDHFTENDTQYLVMEHITGDDLSKRLELTNKPFPLNWVLFWADQLLDALAYLHSHEPPIVHRDIKPQNLKLTDENHIILLDFGLAKNSIGNTRVSTTGGSVVGYTPHYAPMEQIRGTGTNPRSDLYSLSATFYHLLTNTVPSDAITRADSVLNGMLDPIKALYEVNADVPKAISDVILKGMALSMEQRYATARDMQKALREAYAEMQSIMSAQTMAFSTPTNVQNQSMPQHQSEQFPTNLGGQVPSQNPPQPSTYAPQAQNFSQSNDSDATMQYEADQFGFKTEVLPNEMIPRAEDYASPAGKENFNSNQFFSAEQEDFNSDAMIPPMVTFDKPEQSASSNYNSLPKTEVGSQPAADTFSYAAGDTFPPNQNAPQTEGEFQQTPVYTEPKKKSGGKALAIAAGIGGLGVVVVGAAAIGWYALKPSEATVVDPTPTPKVEVTVEPTVVPSVEPTLEANTSGTNSSSDIVSSTPEVTTNDNKSQNTVVTTERTPQTVQPTPVKVVPTPRVVTVKTPATIKTPPRKTPAKTNPTDILQ